MAARGSLLAIGAAMCVYVAVTVGVTSDKLVVSGSSLD